MPCPLPLAPRKTHQPNQTACSFFFSHRTSIREGIHPLRRRIAPIPHHLRSLIRATCFARASAPSTQTTRAAVQLATSCADSSAQDATARGAEKGLTSKEGSYNFRPCRNRGTQLHFVPPASGRRLCI